MAEAAGADLVEISPNADPPVCRIIDYSKFLYQLKKKQKEIKAKSVKVVVKEIRFGPQTDDHDFNFKLKHAIGFLQEGAKVRAYVFFKGRSILFKDQGADLLERFVNALEDYGKLESASHVGRKKDDRDYYSEKIERRFRVKRFRDCRFDDSVIIKERENCAGKSLNLK